MKRIALLTVTLALVAQSGFSYWDPDGRQGIMTFNPTPADYAARDAAMARIFSPPPMDPRTQARIEGFNRMFGGAGEMGAGFAGAVITAPSGVGPFISAAAVAHGGQSFGSGLHQLITAQPNRPISAQALDTVTGNQRWSDMADAGIGTGLSVGPMIVTRATTVNVLRGTGMTAENMAYKETGHLLSDAAVTGYYEGGSISAAYANAEAAHARWLSIWGSEGAYAQAHGAFGTEMATAFGVERSLISVTTDAQRAAWFANFSGSGQVYSGLVPRSSLLPQTLAGAGESEFFLRFGTTALTPQGTIGVPGLQNIMSGIGAAGNAWNPLGKKPGH